MESTETVIREIDTGWIEGDNGLGIREGFGGLR